MQIYSYNYNGKVIVCLPNSILIHDMVTPQGDKTAPGELLHKVASLNEATRWIDAILRATQP